jgi:hypothetical protein
MKKDNYSDHCSLIPAAFYQVSQFREQLGRNQCAISVPSMFHQGGGDDCGDYANCRIGFGRLKNELHSIRKNG